MSCTADATPCVVMGVGRVHEYVGGNRRELQCLRARTCVHGAQNLHVFAVLKNFLSFMLIQAGLVCMLISLFCA